MNRYPLWKYLLITVAVILGILYTTPNFFGETPAVQVSTSRQSIVINEQTQTRVYKHSKLLVLLTMGCLSLMAP